MSADQSGPPMWFVNALVIASLISGAFLQANGLGVVLAALIALALLGTVLNFWKAAR